MPGKFTQHVTQATLQNRFERRAVVIGAVQGGMQRDGQGSGQAVDGLAQTDVVDPAGERVAGRERRGFGLAALGGIQRGPGLGQCGVVGLGGAGGRQEGGEQAHEGAGRGNSHAGNYSEAG